MCAVGVDRLGQPRVVVDDQQRVVAAAEREYLAAARDDPLGGGIFHAQLHPASSALQEGLCGGRIAVRNELQRASGGLPAACEPLVVAQRGREVDAGDVVGRSAGGGAVSGGWRPVGIFGVGLRAGTEPFGRPDRADHGGPVECRGPGDGDIIRGDAAQCDDPAPGAGNG